MKSVLKKILPIFDSLENYSTAWFRNDLIAGLTVAIMLIPQGMAYAYLAGFTSAAALIITINQLKDLLRLEIPRFEYQKNR